METHKRKKQEHIKRKDFNQHERQGIYKYIYIYVYTIRLYYY
jgi:hypothetical protein